MTQDSNNFLKSFLPNWFGSTSVAEEKKAEARKLFLESFDNSETGKLLRRQLETALNTPFSKQLSEAGQTGALQNNLSLDAARNNLGIAQEYDRTIIAPRNAQNVDLKIKFGDAATQNEIAKLRAKADLMGGLMTGTQAHELAVMDRQSADAAANRTHEARNDGYLKAMGVGDLLARIGGAAMLMMG